MLPSEKSIVVITYNIRLGIQEGLPAVARALSVYEPPDILAIQEIGDHWTMGPNGDSTAILAELLQLPHFFHIPPLVETSPDGKEARYGHALLSRWPISSPEILELPRLEDEPRALFIAQIDAPQGPIEVLSTHLSYLKSDRPAQGAFLLQRLQKPSSSPRFLLGDLNADLNDDPDDHWLHHLQTHWRDADGARSRLTFPSSEPRLRLDYIFAQNAQCIDVAVGEDPGPSDHFPLFSKWKTGG